MNAGLGRRRVVEDREADGHSEIEIEGNGDRILLEAAVGGRFAVGMHHLIELDDTRSSPTVDRTLPTNVGTALVSTGTSEFW